MPLLTASGLRKEIAGVPLFDRVSFGLDRGDRIALSGPNGAGKTTLLRLLAGESERSGGELVLAKGARLALHDQRPPAASAESLGDYVLGGSADLIEIEQQLASLEQAMSSGDSKPATLAEYSRLQSSLEHRGGYAWRERARATLRGLGFVDDDLGRALSTFSGGELTRASLARVLSARADVLLLDEPTNHLDLESLEWLELELRGLDAGIVIVAHDRWFLEASTTAVLELENGQGAFFPGSWHVWRTEKAARASATATAAERTAGDLARLERFVARFRYGTRARQAQAKLKQIERLKRDGPGPASRGARTLDFEFPAPARLARVALEAGGLSLRMGDRVLLTDASLVLERGEHVALIGPNGSGKTTLLETLVGRRAAEGGELRRGYGVEIGYFSQHDIELGDRGTVLDVATAMTGLSRGQAHGLLGHFLFSGDEQEKSVVALSGGERRRLALAFVVASGANVLVLDEPTNHLDLESREALEVALERFPGAVLIVSHDRALLDAVAHRVIAVEEGGLRSYQGGWAELSRRRQEERELATPPKLKAREKPRSKPPRGADRGRELAQLEEQIVAAEAAVRAEEARLAEDWSNVEIQAAHTKAERRLESMLARWEELAEREETAPDRDL